MRDTEEIPKFKLYEKVLMLVNLQLFQFENIIFYTYLLFSIYRKPEVIVNQDVTNFKNLNQNNSENSNNNWSDEKLQEKILELKI